MAMIASADNVHCGVNAPAPSAQGAGWYDSDAAALKVWNGSAWVSV